jgi:P-type Ca2+ transporter type 2C
MDYARTLAFTTLVFFQLFNVFNARFDDRSAFHGLGSNRWLWLAVLLSALLQVAVISTPFIQAAFGTVPLSAGDWLICIGIGSSVLWLMELKKLALCLTGRSAHPVLRPVSRMS